MSDLDIEPGDRCDKCGAQAWVKVFITLGGSSLLFCGHHFTERAHLFAGYPTVDHRYRIGAS